MVLEKSGLVQNIIVVSKIPGVSGHQGLSTTLQRGWYKMLCTIYQNGPTMAKNRNMCPMDVSPVPTTIIILLFFGEYLPRAGENILKCCL